MSASRPVPIVSMDVQQLLQGGLTAGASQVQPISAEASNAMWMVSMMMRKCSCSSRTRLPEPTGYLCWKSPPLLAKNGTLYRCVT